MDWMLTRPMRYDLSTNSMRILTRDAQLKREDFERAVNVGSHCICVGGTCYHCHHPGNPVNQVEDKHWEELDLDLPGWDMAMDGAYPPVFPTPVFPRSRCIVPDPVECKTEEEKPVEKKIDYSKITKGLCG